MKKLRIFVKFKKIKYSNLLSVHSVGKEKPERRWVSKIIGCSALFLSALTNQAVAGEAESERYFRQDTDGVMVLVNTSFDYSEFKNKKNIENRRLGTARVDGGQGSLPVYELETFIGVPNESKRSFLIRVGSALHQFAQQVNFEGCGMLAYRADTNQWGVTLTTNRAHLGCVVTDKTPPGMRSAEVTIHNHPEVTRFRLNSQDVNFLGSPHKLGRWETSSHGLGFSEKDLNGKAGFLLDRGYLFYHNGEREIESLGSLNSLKIRYEELSLAEVSVIKKTPLLF